MSDQKIDTAFPHAVSEGYRETSPQDRKYNCIAWADEINNRFMWPAKYGFYWPQGILNEESLNAFIDLYQSSGYQKFSPQTEVFDPEYIKVAIYVNTQGTPTHAARQLLNGKWTSKLGPYKDIEHENLKALEDSDYGTVGIILRKKIW